MTNLLPLLYNHLDWHPSRINCLNEMIFASIRWKTPHHSDMADYLSGDSTQNSKVKRIYRLFKEQEFNVKAFAELLSKFCPEEKWLLTLDRTNWESGPNAINIIRTIKANGSKVYNWFKVGLKVITAWILFKTSSSCSFL